MPRKVTLDHRCAAGDAAVATAAIKALHQSHPGMFLTDFIGHHGRLSGENNLFANSPYITPLEADTSQYVMMDYGYAINNAGRSYHFLHGFVEHLSKKLGVHIELRDFRPDIHLSEAERQPWPDLPEHYAIIDAGIKRDFTAKLWSVHRYQEVVNATKDKIAWVQIGSAADIHPQLQNVVNLVGQTSLRDLCRVMYRASLVLTPISLPMHLAAGVPTPRDGPVLPPLTIDDLHARYYHERQSKLGQGDAPPPLPGSSPKNRPCIVLAGQREQRQWECYPGHMFLGTTGKMNGCCVGHGDACWRNKTVKIDNDTSICFSALKDEVGEFVPECLHRVSIDDVVRAVESVL